MGAYNLVNITVIQNPDLLDRISKNAANEIANASCIIENMALAATDAGIGSVYLLIHLPAFTEDKELLKELNLPEGFTPSSAIALGYPTVPLTEGRELNQKINVNIIKYIIDI